MGVRCDNANTGSPFGARLEGKDGYFAMFATASRTFFDGASPGGALVRSSVLHCTESATQPATAFASELKVLSVDVSVPFGVVASTEPTAPVAGSARFAAMPTAFVIPYRLPTIRWPSMNWAKALPVATVVRSFTTTRWGTVSSPTPIELASMAGPRVAWMKSRGSLSARPRGTAYSTRNFPFLSLLAEPRGTHRGSRSTKAA